MHVVTKELCNLATYSNGDIGSRRNRARVSMWVKLEAMQ